MNEPRYTAEDFDNTYFAAIKNKDGTYQYFLKAFHPFWTNGKGNQYSLHQLIKQGAFPVFAEPYSPESFRFAWEHAEVPSLEEVESSNGSFLSVAMTLNSNGSFTVESGGDLEYFTPRDRFLYRFPTRTRSQRIYELLSEEAPHLASPKLSQLAQAIVELDNEILDILEDN